MSVPRDHHYIPVFYLNHWCGPNEKLVEYARPIGRKVVVKDVGPKATGFKRDLYAFLDLPEETAQFLESHFLAKADELASIVHKKLLLGTATPWTPEIRSAWSRFVMNFLVRHPDPFAEIKAVAHAAWLQPDGITQQRYEELRRPDDPATFEEWVLAQGEHLADRIRIRLIQSVMDNIRVGGRLNGMNWNVLDLSASRFRLLTSDWPLFRELKGERMLFALPISPTKLFTAVTHPDILQKMRQEKPDEVVKTMNAATVAAARRFVYASDRSQDRFIRNRISTAMVKEPFFPSLAAVAAGG
ncbi:hypothetical protein BRADO6401 [Bradyrhizobium sp. ORS 278]|uniref:DUF4238 domain-containing protein n=1 Tax=Bradyrhizobium sp. (strain ORS 278) TaxID=114615 RepID=UPI00015084ED|nr:DUF4238 domain-containing protein [Bradyrhizobium sp. ORS 278]CAL80028.1 hypothetical protein BRADO6401 [Bradyrhizobium sp. ORS 278]